MAETEMLKGLYRLGGLPRPVRDRWWRLKGRKIGGRWARVILRWKLPRSERARKAALASAFETIKSLAIKHENSKFVALSTLGEGLSSIYEEVGVMVAVNAFKCFAAH